MKLSERGLAAALGALRRLGGMEVIDRLGLRKTVENVVYRGTLTGFSAVGAASRNFAKAQKQLTGGAARQAPTKPKPLFDISPTEEQAMLQEAFGDFAAKALRPVALEADRAAKAPDEVIGQSRELGLMMLGVPAELGGVMDERSSITTVLAAEALATGDLGLAVACLAPASVATAIALWGSAEQEGRYLPSMLDENPPDAAIAIMEARPLFDPFELATKAVRDGEGFVLNGAKSMVPLAATAELFIVAADLEGAPALFLVESSTKGLTVEPEPGIGIRAAATGSLGFRDVRLDAVALLGDADPAVYAEAVQRGRLAWSALVAGTGKAVLDYVIPYVNERHAFGEPVSHRQAVAFNISDIAVELEGIRLLTYRAAALADAGKDFASVAAMARHLATEKGMFIGNSGVQLLGGHGYVKEHPVERWYRDLRTAGVMEGALLV